MFRQFFRPKWESPKSQYRQQGIAELDESNCEHAQIIHRLAREDSEPVVRRDAVRKVADLEILDTVLRKDLESSVRDAAHQRLIELLSGKSCLSPDLDTRIRLVQNHASPALLTALIKEAVEPEIKVVAVEQLNDEMYLEEIALHSSIAKLRQAAAEKISSPALLHTLMDASKNRDKSVYRIAKDKLDALNALQRAEVDRLDKLKALCSQMELHAQSAMQPLYAARCDSLVSQWREIADQDNAELMERFESAYALATLRLREVAAIEAQNQARASATQEAVNSVEVLEQTCETLQQSNGGDYDVPSLAALIATQEVRWQEAQDTAISNPALRQRFGKASGTLASLLTALQNLQSRKTPIEQILSQAHEDSEAIDSEGLSQLLSACPFPDDFPQPAHLAELRRLPQQLAFAKLHQHRRPASPENKSAPVIEEARHHMDELGALILQGKLKEAEAHANSLHQAIRNGLNMHGLEERLHQLDHDLSELRDWRCFAVMPKKEELCGKMEALCETPHLPEALLDLIQALRQDWKQLGIADYKMEQPLWERFQAAGEKAYALCVPWLEAQAQIKSDNLKLRQAICDELKILQTLLNGTPNHEQWKKLRHAQHSTQERWLKALPVDHKAARDADHEFRRLQEALKKSVRHEENRNHALMREIIVSARATDELNTVQAVEKIKQLQEQWKLLGINRHKENQRLWNEFRNACDAVFARRQDERNERQAKQQEQQEQALALLTQAENLDISQPEWRKLLKELRNQFMNLGFPQSHLLYRRWDGVEHHLHQRSQSQHREEARLLRQNLILLLQAVEESKPQNAAAHLEHLPQEWRRHCMGFCDKAIIPLAPADNRRDALLLLEAALDIESPQEERGRRQELQLAKLVHNGLTGDAHHLDELIIAALIPAEGSPSQLTQQRHRLTQCLEKAGVGSHKPSH